jgi:hypothetical protein
MEQNLGKNGHKEAARVLTHALKILVEAMRLLKEAVRLLIKTSHESRVSDPH